MYLHNIKHKYEYMSTPNSLNSKYLYSYILFCFYRSRGLASGLCAGLSYLLMFVLTKSYLPIEMYLTLEYTIIVFGIISIFGLVFLYVCLPETENKTLLEIENFFVSN